MYYKKTIIEYNNRHNCFKKALFISLFLVIFIFSGLSKPKASELEYLIGPQDELKIEVWDNPDLTREVTVSSNGSISFPLIGEINADGLTIEQLQKEITKKLSQDYLINPQVTVTIIAYRSKQINIIGEVQKPGTYPYTKNTTIIEIISMAGGLTNEAGSEAFIIHSEDQNSFNLNNKKDFAVKRRQPGDTSYMSTDKINLNNMLESGQDIYFMLKQDDTIYIPRADFFYILGEVKNPGQYKIELDMTVLKAISTAGGYTDKANLKKIIITRVVNEEEKELNGHISDLVLPNDIIKIPESFF